MVVTEVHPHTTSCDSLGFAMANITGEEKIDDRLYQLTLTHGSLMLTGWGLLLPTGVAVAHFGRHRDPAWFKFHRACQMLGLTLTIGGFIIAVTQFNVFQKGYPAKNTAHGTCGIIIMSLGILQPINAFFRPHKEKGHEPTPGRVAWEIMHKGSGYFALLLTIPTIISS